MTTVRANGPRLLRTLRELAGFGANEQGGVSREAFTPAEDAARQYLADIATQAGLYPQVDQAGNLVVRRSSKPASKPALLMGSHLDTVTNGGWLDGAYGVVSALEAMIVLTERDLDTRLEPVVIAFANEEGVRFPLPFWGSRAVVGQLAASASTVDRQGRSIRAPLARAGGDLDKVADAAWPRGTIGAYLELHIEQGPVLESRNLPLGIVDAIAGRTTFEISVFGRQNHAGTTPMSCRSDALVAAAHLVLAIEKIAKQRRLCTVSTVGSLDVRPGVTNVIPGHAALTVEIRDARPERLARAERAVLAATGEVGRQTGTRIEADVAMRAEPVRTDPALRACLAATAEKLALPHLPLSSGAGHDAQIVAATAPVGMIFVPSIGGISHAPDEDTTDADLVAGADALTATAAVL